MIRPRAADDFAMIRARMEELRRERALVPAEPQVRTEAAARVSQAERAGDPHRAIARGDDNIDQATLPKVDRVKLRVLLP